MVSEDIAAMYDQIISYMGSKHDYYVDPNIPDKEFNDFEETLDLTEVTYVIQRHIAARPTIAESGIIKAYRDIRAVQAEYDIRLMNRTAYFLDSIDEEEANVNKWNYNKGTVALHILGRDSGA